MAGTPPTSDDGNNAAKTLAAKQHRLEDARKARQP
jgi:hypothetical protein